MKLALLNQMLRWYGLVWHSSTMLRMAKNSHVNHGLFLVKKRIRFSMIQMDLTGN